MVYLAFDADGRFLCADVDQLQASERPGVAEVVEFEQATVYNDQEVE